jgi:hypothetical protein
MYAKMLTSEIIISIRARNSEYVGGYTEKYLILNGSNASMELDQIACPIITTQYNPTRDISPLV